MRLVVLFLIMVWGFHGKEIIIYEEDWHFNVDTTRNLSAVGEILAPSFLEESVVDPESEFSKIGLQGVAAPTSTDDDGPLEPSPPVSPSGPAPPAECEFGEQICDGSCRTVIDNPRSCGACNVECSLAEDCVGVRCLPRCLPSEKRCNLDVCVDTDTSVHHCGRCNNLCGPDDQCKQGSCAPKDVPDCEFGEVVCDNKCLVVLGNDQACGSCDNACATTEECIGTDCLPKCTSGQLRCDNQCRTSASDAQHCGGCFNACGTDEVCSNSQCIPSNTLNCASNEAQCGDVCKVIIGNRFACGGCDIVCPLEQNCELDKCVDPCSKGNQARCDGSTCMNLNRNILHCGSCGNRCPETHICTSGTCTEIPLRRRQQLDIVYFQREQPKVILPDSTLIKDTFSKWFELHDTRVIVNTVTHVPDDGDNLFEVSLTITQLTVPHLHHVTDLLNQQIPVDMILRGVGTIQSSAYSHDPNACTYGYCPTVDGYCVSDCAIQCGVLSEFHTFSGECRNADLPCWLTPEGCTTDDTNTDVVVGDDDDGGSPTPGTDGVITDAVRAPSAVDPDADDTDSDSDADDGGQGTTVTPTSTPTTTTTIQQTPTPEGTPTNYTMRTITGTPTATGRVTMSYTNTGEPEVTPTMTSTPTHSTDYKLPPLSDDCIVNLDVNDPPSRISIAQGVFIVAASEVVGSNPQCASLSVTYRWDCFIPGTDIKCLWASSGLVKFALSGNTVDIASETLRAITLGTQQFNYQVQLELTATAILDVGNTQSDQTSKRFVSSRTWVRTVLTPPLTAIIYPHVAFIHPESGFRLDASTSWDPSGIGQANPFANAPSYVGLRFVWTACEVSSRNTDECLSHGPADSPVGAVNVTEPVLAVADITRLARFASQVWRFTVVVSHPASNRTAKTSLDLTFLPSSTDHPPSLTLPRSKAPPIPVNPSETLRIQIQVTDFITGRPPGNRYVYRWSSDTILLNSDTVIGGTRTPTLLLAADVLAGLETHTFTLSVSSPGGTQVLQSITVMVIVNQPPTAPDSTTGEGFRDTKVEPLLGNVADDTFVLTSSLRDWMDADGKLFFRVNVVHNGVEIPIDNDYSDWMLFTYPGPLLLLRAPVVVPVLPLTPSDSAQQDVDICLNVADVRGAITTRCFSVIVTQSSRWNSILIRQYTENLLTADDVSLDKVETAAYLLQQAAAFDPDTPTAQQTDLVKLTLDTLRTFSESNPTVFTSGPIQNPNEQVLDIIRKINRAIAQHGMTEGGQDSFVQTLNVFGPQLQKLLATGVPKVTDTLWDSVILLLDAANNTDPTKLEPAQRWLQSVSAAQLRYMDIGGIRGIQGCTEGRTRGNSVDCSNSGLTVELFKMPPSWFNSSQLPTGLLPDGLTLNPPIIMGDMAIQKLEEAVEGRDPVDKLVGAALTTWPSNPYRDAYTNQRVDRVVPLEDTIKLEFIDPVTRNTITMSGLPQDATGLGILFPLPADPQHTPDPGTRTEFNPRCSFWDTQDNALIWSEEGVTTVTNDDGSLICQTSHLTSFSILMIPTSVTVRGAAEQSTGERLWWLWLIIAILVILIVIFAIVICCCVKRRRRNTVKHQPVACEDDDVITNPLGQKNSKPLTDLLGPTSMPLDDSLTVTSKKGDAYADPLKPLPSSSLVNQHPSLMPEMGIDGPKNVDHDSDEDQEWPSGKRPFSTLSVNAIPAFVLEDGPEGRAVSMSTPSKTMNSYRNYNQTPLGNPLLPQKAASRATYEKVNERDYGMSPNPLTPSMIVTGLRTPASSMGTYKRNGTAMQEGTQVEDTQFLARAKLNELKPMLGMSIALYGDDKIVITQIKNGSPISVLPVKPGDFLLSINGTRLKNAYAYQDLVNQLQPGQVIELHVQHRNEVEGRIHQAVVGAQIAKEQFDELFRIAYISCTMQDQVIVDSIDTHSKRAHQWPACDFQSNPHKTVPTMASPSWSAQQNRYPMPSLPLVVADPSTSQSINSGAFYHVPPPQAPSGGYRASLHNSVSSNDTTVPLPAVYLPSTRTWGAHNNNAPPVITNNTNSVYAASTGSNHSGGGGGTTVRIHDDRTAGVPLPPNASSTSIPLPLPMGIHPPPPAGSGGQQQQQHGPLNPLDNKGFPPLQRSSSPSGGQSQASRHSSIGSTNIAPRASPTVVMMSNDSDSLANQGAARPSSLRVSTEDMMTNNPLAPPRL